VGTVQPNYGLDELFGARESYVEFLPDISDDMVLEVRGARIHGRYFRQDYTLNGGVEAGQYPNGTIAAVEHRFGRGRSLLIGSFPGAGYSLHHSPGAKSVFAGFMEWAGVAQRARIDDPSVQARAHQGAGGTYLWVTNPGRDKRTVNIALAADMGSFTAGEDIWGNRKVAIDGQKITLDIPGRDAAVIELR
jgi:beta-galactosidase